MNAPTANTIAAAEHGIALITALSRNVAQADASVKAGKWERTKYVGVSIVGKTLAIMGFGKVTSFLHAVHGCSALPLPGGPQPRRVSEHQARVPDIMYRATLNGDLSFSSAHVAAAGGLTQVD